MHRTRADPRVLAEMVGELEDVYLLLAQQATEGRTYDEVQGTVHAFFLHPGLAELCRAATVHATRRLPGARNDWFDVFQGALVYLLTKVQRAFVSAFPSSKRTLLGFQRSHPGRQAFAGWLYSVLLHACADQCRKLVRHRQRFTMDPAAVRQAPAREEDAEQLERATRLPRMISSIAMDEKMRQVLLGFLDGKSARQIAEMSHRSSRWVTRQKRRGLALLRKHFRDKGEL
jgi:DNA-directed RNA polymerase specialized sigma24 family protein